MEGRAHKKIADDLVFRVFYVRRSLNASRTRTFSLSLGEDNIARLYILSFFAWPARDFCVCLVQPT